MATTKKTPPPPKSVTANTAAADDDKAAQQRERETSADRNYASHLNLRASIRRHSTISRDYSKDFAAAHAKMKVSDDAAADLAALPDAVRSKCATLWRELLAKQRVADAGITFYSQVLIRMEPHVGSFFGFGRDCDVDLTKNYDFCAFVGAIMAYIQVL